ncbi:hypothetical protein [Sorangium sp. So ce124]|uniref:hypothetical protein n=1 Tax=Sorangium sp. So ce124 TaxID=3133280 RepID=UPI003F63B600
MAFADPHGVDEQQAPCPWRFRHDAMGRLVEVTLPSGAHNRVSYDGFGRPARVKRDGVASITYIYAAGSSDVKEKRFATPAGVLVRSVTYVRDGLGRITSETHRDATGKTATFTHDHDGKVIAGQLGFENCVRGEGFSRQTVHRPNGQLASSRITLTQVRLPRLSCHWRR